MSFSRLAVVASLFAGLVLAASPAAGPNYLASKPLPPRTPKALAVGDEVQTRAGERRRLALPDGTLVLLNEQTTLKRTGERDLELSAGEVFVAAGSPLTVHAPRREVKAAAARFAVRTDGTASRVVAAAGSVSVSGLEAPLAAGEQLDAGKDRPTATGRVTHLLSWTRDLLTDGLVPASGHQGGSLVVLDPSGQEQRLALRRYHVDVYIEDGFARTTIDQTYFNHTHARQEGTFRFPLPADASLSRLAMYTDGRLNEGGMVERDYGRMVYRRIVHEQRDPALLEWVDGTTFSLRVFPLEPRQEKRLLLSYTQRLGSLQGLSAYRFPAGHDLTAGQFSVHVRLKGGAKTGWRSDSHSFKATTDGEDLLLDATAKDSRIDRDVALEVSEAAGDGAGRFSSAEQDGGKYLLLRWRPQLRGGVARAPRHWIFLFESSGDRDPVLARTQIEIIRGMLASAGEGDRFNVLTAGTRVHALSSGQPLPVTPQKVQDAIRFLEKAHLVGALDLGQALKLEALTRSDVKNPWLVHVGSGIAAMGERRDPELVKRIPDGTTYVGVGVGKRWNRSFMKLAAEKTGGYFTQINPDEPVAWRAFDLAATLDTPRLLDVKVTDRDGKATFLPFTTLVAQGEELAAVARVDREAALPEAVVVTGILNGEPYRQELKVQGVREKADYLPRTWARLEIDRLLAADATKNKDRIIELSKAMYVMTPFTSLLVLENEEMYQQFKVDRGRKDHWAMYPAPERIDVVYEPEDGPPFDPRKGIRPSAEQVAKTIVVLDAPKILRPREAAGERPDLREPVFTAAQSAEPEKDATSVAATSPDPSPRGAAPILYAFASPDDGKGTVLAGGLIVAGQVQELRRNRHERALESNLEFDKARLPLPDEAPIAFPRRYNSNGSGPYRDILVEVAEDNTGSLIFGVGVNSPAGLTGAVQSSGENREGRPPQSHGYGRPSSQGKDDLYFKLTAYAPGLNTTTADILDTIEREAAADGRGKAGAIDDGVRELFARASEGGWRSLKRMSGDGESWTVTFDGAGHLTWERRLPVGLLEKVVCDGKTLWHLYPEIGVAARRTVGRAHRVALSNILPWALPLPEDLARGADLRLREKHVVAVVPHGAGRPGRDGKPQPHRELHLVFSSDGDLAARRIVEMPSGKTLFSEELTPDGVIRHLDTDGKPIATLKGSLAKTTAPELKPNVSDLVVLPLPYRTVEHVRKSLGIEKKSADTLTFDEGRALLAANFAAANTEETLRVFNECFHRRDQRQLGYYVLLAACGVNLDAEHTDVLAEHRDAPLAQYLALYTSPVLRKHASQWAAASNSWGDGFLDRLATLHALCQHWSEERTGDVTRGTDLNRALKFVRKHKGTVFGWAVLGLVADRAADAERHQRPVRDVHRVLADVWPLFADVAALRYAARYEEARSLWKAGEGKRAAKLFLELYEETLAAGALPPIDGDFRAALLEAAPAEGGWSELLRATADRLVKKGQRPALLALARQCWQIGDAAASQRVYDVLHDHLAAGKDHIPLMEAVLDFLEETGQLAAADTLLQGFLGTPSSAKDPRVLRRAYQLAGKRNMPRRELEYLEQLLEQEFEKLPEIVDLTAIRKEYEDLLRRYENQAKAVQSLGLVLPGDFQAKVIRVADRWRALDRDSDDPCNLAARILQTLGDRESAWDYLTTPIAGRPNESRPWANLAATLAQEGEWSLAENAYAAACQADPTNAQVLWDRAHNLTQAGRLTQAAPLYRRLADGPWAPEYRGLQEQARTRLGSR
jgi:ferric-dicitrate binding protein FerR (iron transport regulator)